MTQDTLEHKRELLEEYEKSEREAKRLEEALSRGRVNGLRSPSSPPEGEEGQSQAQGEAEEPGSAFLPPHPGPNLYKRRAPGMGLLNALSYTLHGMMDVDPETARRSGISKTREGISQVCPCHDFPFFHSYISLQLEDALHLSAQDLKYASSTIQADLDRFQRQKVADLREMTISMARSHRDWCKKVRFIVMIL